MKTARMTLTAALLSFTIGACATGPADPVAASGIELAGLRPLDCPASDPVCRGLYRPGEVVDLGTLRNETDVVELVVEGGASLASATTLVVHTNGLAHTVAPRVERRWESGATLVAEIPVAWLDDRETLWEPTADECALPAGASLDEIVVEAVSGDEWLGEIALETMDRTADADVEACNEEVPSTAWAGPNQTVPFGCYCNSSIDSIFCLRFAPLTGWYTYCTNCCN